MTDLFYDSFLFTNNSIKRMNLHLGKRKAITKSMKVQWQYGGPGYVIVPETDIQEGRQRADMHLKKCQEEKECDSVELNIRMISDSE